MSTPLTNSVRSYLASHHMFVDDEWLTGCIEYLTQDVNSNQSECELQTLAKEQWLLNDLKDICPGSLPANLKGQRKTTLNGRFVLQINAAFDIGTPAYQQYLKLQKVNTENIEATTKFDDKIPNHRMIKLHMTDGVQEVSGIEYRPMRNISADITPGCKVLIKGPIECRRGVMLLSEPSVELLGGEVQEIALSHSLPGLLATKLGVTITTEPNNPALNARNTDIPAPYSTMPSRNTDPDLFTQATEQSTRLITDTLPASAHDRPVTNHNQLSMDYDQSSINLNQAATIYNQPSSHNRTTMNHNQPSINHNPSSMNHNPSSMNYNPVATNSNQSSMNSNRPSTHNQPSMNYNQSSTNHNRPTTDNSRPIARVTSVQVANFIDDDLDIDIDQIAAIEAQINYPNAKRALSEPTPQPDKKIKLNNIDDYPTENDLFLEDEYLREIEANFDDKEGIPQKRKSIPSEPYIFIKQINELPETKKAGRVFKVKGQIIKLLSKLTVSKDGWSLRCTIIDGTGSLDVDFTSGVLSKLVGYTPQEMNQLKKEMVNKPELKQKAVLALQNAKEALQVLNCIIELTMLDVPKITQLIPFDDSHVDLLRKRSNNGL